MFFSLDSVCHGDDSDPGHCVRHDRHVRRASRNRRWSLSSYHHPSMYTFQCLHIDWLQIVFQSLSCLDSVLFKHEKSTKVTNLFTTVPILIYDSEGTLLCPTLHIFVQFTVIPIDTSV